jgi:hypothetical protein
VISVLVALSLSAGAAKSVQLPSDALKWEDSIAPVSGDRKKGPFSFFLRLSAGSESGFHVEDSEWSGVVITGVLEQIEQGGEAEAKPLPPGSYFLTPAKKSRNTVCTAGADCLLYVTAKSGLKQKK